MRNFSGFAQLSHQFLMILDPLHGRGRFGQVLGSNLDKCLTYPQIEQTEDVARSVPVTAGELVQNKLKEEMF